MIEFTKFKDSLHHKLYADNVEMNLFADAVQPVIDAGDEFMVKAINNTFAKTADIDGIERFEREYDLRPDLDIDTLEDRRERILDKKSDQSPFTENWLNFELARRFPDGSVTAIVDEYNLYLHILLNVTAEEMRTRRRIRELMPWIRGFIPTKVIIHTTHSHITETVHGKVCYPMIVGGVHRVVNGSLIEIEDIPYVAEETHLSAKFPVSIGGFHRVVGGREVKPPLPPNIIKGYYQFLESLGIVDAKGKHDDGSVNQIYYERED